MPTRHTICAVGALLVSQAAGHSWVEQMQVIGSNGSYVGGYGYPRGYTARTDPGYDASFSVQWLLPPSDGQSAPRINDSMFACHPYQRTQNYTSTYPKLKVSPGDYVAMKYLENGHVTQPWTQKGKPYGGGTVFVYGTTQPDTNTRLVDVLEWNEDGSGGNKQGWLMTAQNFDDERCHQISVSPISIYRQQTNPDRPAGQPDALPVEQWCETDLKIPDTVNGSSITAYWVWQWPTAAGSPDAPGGKDEYYTTCLDFDVANNGMSNTVAKMADQPNTNTLAQQDPQSLAPKNYMSRTAKTSSASVTTWGQIHVAMTGTQTITAIPTYWNIPAATHVNNGTTYELAEMGTALNVNGQLTAFVDCTNSAVTTGSVMPSCSSSPWSYVLSPTAPAPATTNPSSYRMATGTAIGVTPTTTNADHSGCGGSTVTVTTMITITAPVMESPTTAGMTSFASSLSDTNIGSSSPATSSGSNNSASSLTLSASTSSSFSLSFTYPTISVPNYATAIAAGQDTNDQSAFNAAVTSNSIVYEHAAAHRARHARNFHHR